MAPSSGTISPYGTMWRHIAHQSTKLHVRICMYVCVYVYMCGYIYIYIHVSYMSHVTEYWPIGLQSAPSGTVLHHLVSSGHLRANMSKYGAVCAHIGPDGSVYAPYGHMWANMAHMDPHGHTRNLYDTIWLYLAPYGRYDTYGVNIARCSPI